MKLCERLFRDYRGALIFLCTIVFIHTIMRCRNFRAFFHI